MNLLDLDEAKEIRIELRSRLNNPIDNNQFNTALPLLTLSAAEDIKKKFNYAEYRTAQCGYYNCHGLTFASRRTRIWKSIEVGKILMEDGYKAVDQDKVIAGDTIIYYNGSDPCHSGIVLEVMKSVNYILQDFKILSKWGYGHEVCHTLKNCDYWSDTIVIKFYRIISEYHHNTQLYGITKQI